MLKTKSEPTKTTDLIACVYDAEPVQAAMQRRDSLRQRLTQLEASTPETKRNDINAAARALVDGGGVAVCDAPSDVRRERDVVGRALQITEGELRDAIQSASESIVAAARPAHDALMCRISESLSTLVAAAREEDNLVRTLVAGGVQGVGDLIRPDVPVLAGDLFRRLRLLNFAEWKNRVRRLGIEL